MLTDIQGSILFQEPHGVVDILVKDKGTIVAQEMLSQDTGQAHSHIWDLISYDTQELKLQVFLKDFLFIHGLTAHKDENLSSLEGLRLEEILSNTSNNRFEFV